MKFIFLSFGYEESVVCGQFEDGSNSRENQTRCFLQAFPMSSELASYTTRKDLRLDFKKAFDRVTTELSRQG